MEERCGGKQTRILKITGISFAEIPNVGLAESAATLRWMALELA